MFHVITYVNKDCLFEAESPAVRSLRFVCILLNLAFKAKKEWLATLNQAIQEANAAAGFP